MRTSHLCPIFCRALWSGFSNPRMHVKLRNELGPTTLSCTYMFAGSLRTMSFNTCVLQYTCRNTSGFATFRCTSPPVYRKQLASHSVLSVLNNRLKTLKWHHLHSLKTLCAAKAKYNASTILHTHGALPPKLIPNVLVGLSSNTTKAVSLHCKVSMYQIRVYKEAVSLPSNLLFLLCTRTNYSFPPQSFKQSLNLQYVQQLRIPQVHVGRGCMLQKGRKET